MHTLIFPSKFGQNSARYTQQNMAPSGQGLYSNFGITQAVLETLSGEGYWKYESRIQEKCQSMGIIFTEWKWKP